MNINSNIKAKPLLDAGSGFGGTLNYFRKSGFKNISGIDIDLDSVNYSKFKYPTIDVQNLDLLKVDNSFPEPKFNVITLFNVFYVINEKHIALNAFSKVSKEDGILVLFDYSRNNNNSVTVKDFAGKTIYPINLNTIRQELEENNWQIFKQEDITKRYINWYQQFLIKLSGLKSQLVEKYKIEDITKVENTFKFFLEELSEQRLGGVLIYAVKNKSEINCQDL